MSGPKSREVRIAAARGIAVVGEFSAIPLAGPVISVRPVLGRADLGVRFVVYLNGSCRGEICSLWRHTWPVTWWRRRVAFRYAVKYLRSIA